MARHRSYSKEFKEQAVNLIESSDKSLAEIAADLGIAKNMLWRWKKELQDANPQNLGSRRQGTDLEEEIKRLNKELYLVTMERDILKKAVAICSKEPLK